MFHDIVGWFGDALEVVPIIVTLLGLKHRRLRRRHERYRSFKGWGIEWTAYDRDDQSRS
jgi:hypothetical protein